MGRIPESQPPDPIFVVFCRVCGIDDMAGDRFITAQQALAGVCADRAGKRSVYAVHSSVYGRFLCVEKPRAAVETATTVLKEAAGRGVHLAVGIDQGRLGRVRDLGHENLIGPPINVAARLAAIAEKSGCSIVVTPRAKKTLCDAVGKYRELFSDDPQKASGKRDEVFLYHEFPHDRPALGELADCDTEPEIVHALVYDVARFSAMSPGEAWAVLTHLREKVVGILGRTGGLAHFEANGAWYAPAGDGGVLVFSNRVTGDTALDVAEKLAVACRGTEDIRIGLAGGTAVIIDDNLPVGSGILRADHLSALPATGYICVDRTFWEDRQPADKKRWTVRDHEGDDEHEKDTDALLVFPPGIEPPTPPPSPGADLGDLLPNITRYLRELREKHPQLHGQVIEGLRQGNVKHVGAEVDDLVSIVEQAGIHEVLAALRRWLGRPDPPAGYDWQALRTVLAYLLVLGITDTAWLGAAQTRRRDAKFDGRFEVHAGVNKIAAAVLVAGIFDVAVRLAGGTPEGFIPLDPDVAPSSDDPRDRLDQLKQYLRAQFGSEEDVIGTFEADLAANQPWYVLLGADDALASAIAADGLGGLLLVLRERELESELIEKTAVLKRHVEQLFGLLDRLAGTSGTGRKA